MMMNSRNKLLSIFIIGFQSNLIGKAIAFLILSNGPLKFRKPTGSKCCPTLCILIKKHISELNIS